MRDGMPILAETGRCLGALLVTSTTRRNNLAAFAMLVPLVRHSARKIAQAAHDWGFPETAPISHAKEG